MLKKKEKIPTSLQDFIIKLLQGSSAINCKLKFWVSELLILNSPHWR